MRWLLEVERTADRATVERVVRDAGGRLVDDQEPVPLGDSTEALAAVGPESLAAALEDSADIVDVFPDSEMQPYGG